jgi:hypothetical protein
MSNRYREFNLRIILWKILLFISILGIVVAISCGGGPVGGFQVSVNMNDSLARFADARIYVDKINLFERADGTTGYEILPSDATDFSHMLFNLVGGASGADPVFSLSWTASVQEISETIGKNYAAYSIKMFPDLTEYRQIAKSADYMASYNAQTCFIIVVITNVNTESAWMNGIFNGVYIEKVGDKWRRIQLREGRFGANYSTGRGITS